jgi:hypothetical protein
MAKPAWENLVALTIESHRPDATISTSSADPKLENADRIDHVNRHHGEPVPKAIERSWDKSPLRYCPSQTVSRGHMAAFMNATFFP